MTLTVSVVITVLKLRSGRLLSSYADDDPHRRNELVQA